MRSIGLKSNSLNEEFCELKETGNFVLKKFIGLMYFIFILRQKLKADDILIKVDFYCNPNMLKRNYFTQ